MGGEALGILAGALPVAGAFGSAALQQHYAQKNWKQQNAYNHPKQQIARLKEAGLPLATMFGGQGGSTSSPIPTPNVDPSLGTAQGVNNFQQTMMQRKQLDLMDQELRTKTAAADIAEAERDFQLSRQIDGTIPIKDFEPQFGDSNMVQGMRRERAAKQADLEIRGIEKGLKQIDLDMSPEKIRSAIDQVLASTALINLNIQKDEAYYGMIDQIAKDMRDGGAGFDGVGRLIRAWFYKIALRQ